MRYSFTFCALLAVAVAAALALAQADSYPIFGNRDFIEYWCAYQLGRTGQNPYDSSLLFTFQRSIGWNEPAALMMWNPPWLLTLLSPILSFPFYDASKLFIVLNVALLALSAAFGWKLISDRRPIPPVVILAALLFFPLKLALDMGQVSVLITAALIVGLWALRFRYDLLAGVLLSLLTIKPHLVYLPLILVTWVVLKEKRWKVVVGGLGTLAVLLLGTALLFPGTIGFWRNTLDHGAAGEHTVQVVAWQVASLVGAIRVAIGSSDIRVHQLIMVLVPGITAVGFLWWLTIVKRPSEWWTILPWLLPLSMLTSPFGWLFDHSIAVLTQLAAVAVILHGKLSNRARIISALSLISVNGLVPILLKGGLTMHHHYFWFPAALLLIFEVTRRSDLRATQAAFQTRTPRP